MERKKLTTFFRPKPPTAPSPFPSSDPFEPLPQSSRAPTPRTLAVEIPPNVLRPVAFRIFTKKHNLTLKSDALTLLCSFIGRRCGADWRNSGAGEKLLDEIARQWKRNEGASGVLVDGGDGLKSVLRGLEVPGGGAAGGGDLLRREQSWDLGEGVSSSVLYDGEIEARGVQCEVEVEGVDPKRFLKVVGAFEMPKWNYNVLKRGFEKAPKPTLFPPASAKTHLFRTRFALLHQRLLRTELFLPPTFNTSAHVTKHHKLTPIANLLGRASQSFLLFGMLSINPSGVLTLLDNTGEIILDLSIASAVPDDGSWFTPGCFCIVDGAFEEDSRFTVFTLGQPLPERREASAEVFGHVDFLGGGVTLDMGVEGGGLQGRAMRAAEKGGGKMVFCGEVELDGKGVLDGLRGVLELYREEPPMVVVLLGNFTKSAMGTSGGSVAYKEYFDQLASLLANFPEITATTTFVFVPGDNDPWASTFSGGSSTTLPRRGIPDIFTSRIKRVFQQSSKGADGSSGGGEALWTTNPCRIGYFTQEIVVCRDDMVGRLRRNGINFKKSEDDEMEVEDYGMDVGDYAMDVEGGEVEVGDSEEQEVDLGGKEVDKVQEVDQGVYEERVGQVVHGEGPVVEEVHGGRVGQVVLEERQNVNEEVFEGQDVERGIYKKGEVVVDLGKYGEGKVVDLGVYGEGKEVDPEIYGEGKEVDPEIYGEGKEVDSEIYVGGKVVDPEVYGEGKEVDPGIYKEGETIHPVEVHEVTQETKNARKLVKTILDQGYLSPFSLSTRPMLWDYWHTLMLYPLPNMLVLSDPAMQPFSLTYEGCHVLNPGRMVERRTARWVEYTPATGTGVVRDVGF